MAQTASPGNSISDQILSLKMQHPLAAGRHGTTAERSPGSPVRSVSSVNGRNRRRAGSSASTNSGTSFVRPKPKLSPRGVSSGLLGSAISPEGDLDNSIFFDDVTPNEAETISPGGRGLDLVALKAPYQPLDVQSVPEHGEEPLQVDLPRTLRHLPSHDLALLAANLDEMDADELARFIVDYPPRAGQNCKPLKRESRRAIGDQSEMSSTPRTPSLTSPSTEEWSNLLITPRPPPRRSLTTSSSISLPGPISNFQKAGTPILLSSPDPSVSSSQAGSATRTRLPYRQSSMSLLVRPRTMSEECPLFPPSPPAVLPISSRSGARNRNEDGVSSELSSVFLPLRAFARLARDMKDIIGRLEQEQMNMRAELDANNVGTENYGDRVEAARPTSGSVSSAKSLPGKQDDQRSINDSLNEAISTSLGGEFPDAFDFRSSPRSQTLSSALTLAGGRGAGEKVSLRKKKDLRLGMETTARDSTKSSHDSKFTVPPPKQRPPAIRVRQAERSLHQEADRGQARSSWTSGLWAWNSTTPERPRNRSDSRSTSVSGLASPGNERVSFEPAPAKPSISAQRDTSPFVIGAREEDLHVQHMGESSPAFKAIVLATALPPSSLIAYLAHTLIAQAREEGVKVQKSIRRGSMSSSYATREAPDGAISPFVPRKPTTAVTTTISNAISNSFGIVTAAIGSQDKSARPAQASSSAAKKALLRTLSSKASRAPEATYAEEAEELVEAPMSSVELNALVAPENRPPTMLLRRNTVNNNRPAHSASMKVATQFATSEILDYTDRYGFVYDMRYVRMLLDLKAAAAEIPQETPLDEINSEFFAMRAGIARGPSDNAETARVIISPDASPPPAEVDRLGEPHLRTRASTIASFKPPPVKSTAMSQDVQVSARGSVDLQTRVPSGNWRTYSGSIQIKANNLEKLANLNRKPISSLLSQLSEVHDRQEVERQKAWQTFVKDRQYKTRKAHGRRATVSLDAWSSVANAFQPSKSKVFVDDQKWQGASLGISQMGLGKSGADDIKRFFDLVRGTGIPIVLRSSVWWECTGAMDAFVPGEYQEILSIHAVDEHPVLGEIEKDVGRTFPTNVFFGGDGVGCRKLRRLLTAYAWHDPSIGYCQGMNLLAATLLLTYDDEEKAYWTMLCIIKNLLPEDWFTSALTGSMTEQAVLSQYVSALLPEVSEHLSELGLDELSSLTFGWLLSVFTSCLPIDTLLRVWDCFIVCGKDTIIRMAMAILSLAKDDILACESAADVFECLNGMTEKMWGADKLIHIEKQLQSSMKSDEIAGKRTMHLRMLALDSGDGEVDLLA